MTQPKHAQQRGNNRVYTWGSENFFSVTSLISGGVPKPALVPWGMKAVAEGAISKRKVIQEMTAGCQTPDQCARGHFCPDCDEAVRWLKGIPYSTRDRASDLGTSLHEAIEAHMLDKPQPPWPITIRRRMEHFVRFLEEWQPEIEMSEASVFNRAERYAGTLDMIVRMMGSTWLIDVKSGKGVYPESALQLSAYRFSEFAGMPDGSEQPMPAIDQCAVLHLTDEGYSLVPVVADERVFKAFQFAREVFRWQNETSKGVIGQPLEPADKQEALL